MNLSTIEQGEELLKRATPGPWFYDGIGYLFQGTPQDAQMVADDGDGKQIRMRGVGADLPLDVNGDLIAFLRNNASELLQCAREVEGLKSRIEVLENPLPTQEEEREFYHRAYHVCHTGCPMPCPNRT